MTDPLAAVCQLLLKSPEVELNTKGYVFAGVFAPEKVRDLPRSAVVIRGIPSYDLKKLDTVHEQRAEIVCMASSSEKALETARVVFDTLAAVERRVEEGVFIHHVLTTGAVEQRINSETMLHEAVRTALIIFDETEV